MEAILLTGATIAACWTIPSYLFFKFEYCHVVNRKVYTLQAVQDLGRLIAQLDNAELKNRWTIFLNARPEYYNSRRFFGKRFILDHGRFSDDTNNCSLREALECQERLNQAKFVLNERDQEYLVELLLLFRWHRPDYEMPATLYIH